MRELPELSYLLPHTKPMLMVDELVAVGPEQVHCRTCVSGLNPFFDAQRQHLPGYVGIELLAQTVAGWAGYQAWQAGRQPDIGFLLGSRRYHSEVSAFDVGTVLDLYGERILDNQGMAVFSCRIEIEGQSVATSQLNVYVPATAKLAQMVVNPHDKEQRT